MVTILLILNELGCFDAVNFKFIMLILFPLWGIHVLILRWIMQDDRVATAWLNNEEVRKAIHAKEVRDNFLICTWFKDGDLPLSEEFFSLEIYDLVLLVQQTTVTGPWELCTGKIHLIHDSGSMIKYHKNLTARGYRALIYRFNRLQSP